MEATLDDFSFEELSVAEAGRLKKLFDTFKTQLEKRIWGEVPEPSEPESKKKSQKLKSRSEEMLIATVSHEIRTPLSGIIGFTDLLKETELTEEQLTQVNAIQSASGSLMEIINELLEYSKLSAGLEIFEEIDFNFFRIVQDVVYLCKTLMLGKEVELRVELDPNIPKDLMGDPSKLSQVLLNLLGNSIKFVEKGSILLKVDLLKEKRGEVWLQFMITDTGIGIAEEDLKHIFSSFKQATQQTFTKYGGTGLGLNIVKQIVQRLKGEIEVTSILGEGTTFVFSLPYKKGHPGKEQGLSLGANPQEVKGMRVLVFEDNPLNVRLIEQRLKSWGCKTYVAENPLFGLKLMESTAIDLVLMDLRMPVMDGFEATQKIRSNKNKQIREVPVIALTADFTAEDKLECDQKGINDFILKPFSPEELLGKMIANKKGLPTDYTAENKDDCRSQLRAGQLFSLDAVLEECMGELPLLEELIGLYQKNALEFIGQVKVHLKNKDHEGVAFASHKIKCGLKMMKTFGLCAIVEELHSLAKTNRDDKKMHLLYNRFVREYPKVEQQLNNALNDLKQERGEADG